MAKGQPLTTNIRSVLNQAQANIEGGRLDAAEVQYRWALGLAPGDAQLHLTLGLLLLERGQIKSAIAEIECAIRLDGSNANAFRGLGDALAAADLIDQAISAYQRASTLAPSQTDTLLNLGNVLQNADHPNQALSAYGRVLAIDPQHPKALNNIGKTYQDMGQLERAVGYYSQALTHQPEYAEAHFNRSIAKLTLGDYAGGWEEYEWRFKRKLADQVYPHRLTSPRWQGEIFGGRRLLVHCEQGYGDMLQFLRYLPMVKQRGGTVIVEAQPPLLPLLERLNAVDHAIAYSRHQPAALQHDLHVPMMSLPHVFGTTDKTIPNNFPYIKPIQTAVDRWRRQLPDNGIRIGFVWASSAVNPKRNFPLQLCTPWLEIPGLTFFGLQKGPAAKELQRLGIQRNFKNLGPKLNDFNDTAALIANLDLVISVDTAVAHLTGALDVPLWILLPQSADWRWPAHLRRSPWYPNARIFRQSAEYDWDRIAADIKQALKGLPRQSPPISPFIATTFQRLAVDQHHGVMDSGETPNGLRNKITKTPQLQYSPKPITKAPQPSITTIAAQPKIKKVLLVSPIYGGSLEVVRYLTLGFRHAGLATLFVDNSTHYEYYCRLNRTVADEGQKQLKIDQMLAELNQKLLESAARFKPDLLIAIAQSPMDIRAVHALRKKGITCAYWFVEDYRFRDYWSQIAPAYDFFFMIQRDKHLNAKFSEMGNTQGHYLPLACEPSVHKPWAGSGAARQPYDCQLGFMGAPYLNRLKVFDRLTHFDLKIWGEGWRDHVLSRELDACVQGGRERIGADESVKIYSSAQILVNLHSSPFDEGICAAGDFINPRTFEVAGCGGFQLTDYRSELPDLFEPGKEIAVFHDIEELQDLIPYWLSHDRLRTEMARRAQQRAYSQHTYRHRANEILQLIQGDGVLKAI